MLQNKVTRYLLFVLVFVMVLNVGLLVGSKVVNNKTAQVASVASSQKDDGSGERGEGEEPRLCRAFSDKAKNYTKYNEFGLGTELQPYEIWTPKQFVDITNAGFDPYYYLQCSNISFSTTPQFTIPVFVGHYNGNYYTLQEYKYIGDSAAFVGIFEKVQDGATIDHVRIARSNLQLNGQNGAIAVLAGELTDSKINDIKLYSSNVSAAYTSAAALVVQSYKSEATNIEINGTTVRAKYNASGMFNFVINSKVKNAKVVGGTVLAVSGHGAGIANIFDSNQFLPVSGVFENISYKGTSVAGTQVAGVVNSLDNATLSYAEVEAPLSSVADTNNNSTIGGVVGQGFNASVEKSHFNGTIDRKAFVNNVCGTTNYAGGVAGLLHNSSIYWSYAIGQIKVTDNCGGTGGVVGVGMDSTVQNSYADIGFSISGSNGPLGGLAGTILNSNNSLSSYYKNRTTIRVIPLSGGTVTILGGHIGLAVGSSFPSDMSYTSGSLPNVSAFNAGPYVGLYSNTSGNNFIPSTIYYVESSTCSGNCNTIGTAKSQAYLLNPVNLPMSTWEFSPTKWVQASLGQFPLIPSAKSNF
ncbi:MAG: hypothetical protein KBC12_00120 [Candidatus Pacebacteria bacterium]|nr:hypothetical protein [Candidatus Paceibacterota bacterium]MBP9851607.1 hypothetical protein [Candidatus Paceibacterota bacterium]